MLLALISDTHDNVANTRAAIKLLAPHNPDLYLHAGDLVAPDMLDCFVDLPFHFIFGNNEYDLPAIRAKARSLNLACHNHFAEFTFDDKKIALHHGHDTTLLRGLFAPQTPYDYIISGHTHVRRDQRQGATRHINPGALHRARQKSVALLDLRSDTLTFLELS
jgi:putative phosphoesterase